MSDDVRYHSFIASNDRWGGFALRDDDIIITTPSKSGTTWMQTLVALLLFDGVPPAPVHELSPWLDSNLRPGHEVHALLEAQRHRRFIKTHTPLDGLPWDDGVTYLTVGRDPRDAFVSMLHHIDNLRRDDLRARRIAAVGDDDLEDLPDRWPDDEDPRAMVQAFLELDRGRNSGDMCLAHLLHHLRLAWEARDRPNLELFHFVDLAADLPGELRRLRDVLGTDHSDGRVAELAEQATLDAMRDRATDTAPEVGAGVWKDPARFFRGGRHGDGQRLMTDDELARYRERCRELVDDEDPLAWVHGGTQASTATDA